MAEAWHIRGGRVIDPAEGREEIRDLVLADGVIAEGNSVMQGVSCREIDARGLLVLPGLMDIHTHLREPGMEEAETIATACRAAAHGGFTAVTAMPNTTPCIDSPAMVRDVLRRSRKVQAARVFVTGCATQGRRGEALADLPGMVEAGAVAFTDDGAAVREEEAAIRAMETCRKLDVPLLEHALDERMAKTGVLREGNVSMRWNLPGVPRQAEMSIVERDLRLARKTGCRLHIQHLSTREAVSRIRQAKKDGVPVTAEVTPHHLALTVDDLKENDTSFKVNPPLGDREDREALMNAVVDGTIDAFATDHAPHPAAEKRKGFRDAPFGAIGLETAASVTFGLFVASGRMSVLEWAEKWTVGPARILGRKPPALRPGSVADVVLFDLRQEWTVRSSEFLSRSTNTPFEGRTLKGKPVRTFCGGVQTWPAENT